MSEELEERLRRVKELREQGHSIREIASALGLGVATVHRYLKMIKKEERRKKKEERAGEGKEGQEEAKASEEGPPKAKASERSEELRDEELVKAIRELGMEREEEEKREEKVKRGRNLMIEAMKMLDEGASPIEVMVKYNIDPLAMKGLIKTYRDIVGSPREDSFLTFKRIATLFGEQVRDRCDYYDVERGVCTDWSLSDVDEDFRRRNPDLLKVYGGKLRFRVSEHPWVCALCRAVRS